MRKGGSYIAGEASSEIETTDQAQQETPAQADAQQTEPAPAPAYAKPRKGAATDTSEE